VTTSSSPAANDARRAQLPGRHRFAAGDLVGAVVDWEMAPVDGMLTAAETLEIRDRADRMGELIYDAEELRKAMRAGPG
jgi:hypothetical protein